MHAIASAIVAAYLLAAAAAAQQSQASQSTQVLPSAVYRVAIKYQDQRIGVTKNVEVELRRYKEGGTIYRRVSALPKNQFALRKPGEADKSKTALERVLVPIFLPGDSGIHIKISPQVGFTELLSLKFLDPVVLTIHQDGLIEADRGGVRAVLLRGTVLHSECFWPAMPNEDGSYNIGTLVKPSLAQDGSLILPAGELIRCDAELQGEDGDRFISFSAKITDRSLFAFVLARSVGGRDTAN